MYVKPADQYMVIDLEYITVDLTAKFKSIFLEVCPHGKWAGSFFFDRPQLVGCNATNEPINDKDGCTTWVIYGSPSGPHRNLHFTLTVLLCFWKSDIFNQLHLWLKMLFWVL